MDASATNHSPLLAALARAEAATSELTTRGSSALPSLRAAVRSAAATATATAAGVRGGGGGGCRAYAAAAAPLPPSSRAVPASDTRSLTEDEVQAVWDAALKLWVSFVVVVVSFAFSFRRRLLFFSRFASFSPPYLSFSLPRSKKQQNTCVDACNEFQPPAWHVEARQLAW